MPVWAVQLIVAVIPWIGKWIDRMLSERHTPTLKRINKTWTVEKIAEYGKKKGLT